MKEELIRLAARKTQEARQEAAHNLMILTQALAFLRQAESYTLLPSLNDRGPLEVTFTGMPSFDAAITKATTLSEVLTSATYLVAVLIRATVEALRRDVREAIEPTLVRHIEAVDAALATARGWHKDVTHRQSVVRSNVQRLATGPKDVHHRVERVLQEVGLELAISRKALEDTGKKLPLLTSALQLLTSASPSG